MDLQTLTDSFAILGMLAFDETETGLVRARVTTPACTAELYLHGAHLTHWQPAGHGPVLFLSEQSSFAPDKAIRGGVPIVFPWFGPRAGARTDGPMHGFARIEAWELAFAALSGDDLHLTLTLAPTKESRALGFDNFGVALQLVLGETLTMRLTVANESAAPIEVGEAFHTYFTVGDAAQVRITGLADVEYIDKTDGFSRKFQTEPVIRIAAATDRLYLNTTAAVTLEDPTLRRAISIVKQGSQSTVVWNPWQALPDMADDAWRGMTCVETANAGDNALTIAPQSTHTMESRISVESL
jgi:glucose-6-phosphate 1-epimerase